MLQLDRIKRVYRRSGSMRNFVATAREELFVRAWSRAKVRKLASTFISDYEPKKWIFLVGCYNSGTTILQKILNAHPSIAGIPREGVRFTNVLSNLEEHGHHMIWSEDFEDFIEPSLPHQLAYQQIKKDWGIFWRSGCTAFLDKSIANTARINWLNHVFPDSVFIGIHRNGYCVSEGLQRRAIPPSWLIAKNGSQKYPLETVANQWVCSNEMMLDQFATLPGSSILVGFEDFVGNPVDTTVGILEHLGLDSEAVSSKSGSLIMNGQKFEIRDPNPASLDRLDSKSIEIVAPILQSMMQKLRYE